MTWTIGFGLISVHGLLKVVGEMGATGVIVPWGPSLLDLLRRPDEEDDRSDLLVAQG